MTRPARRLRARDTRAPPPPAAADSVVEASGTQAAHRPAPPLPNPRRSSHPAKSATCPWKPDRPVNDRCLTDLPFNATSFWIQPWRAYLDTWPASRLLNAIGVNFNVRGAAARDVARLLHESGFRLARVGLNWGGVSDSNPRRFVHEVELREQLLALREYGLRPLLLLNADSGAPCPSRRIDLATVASAPAGAQTVTLSSAAAAAVVPGKSGFDAIALNPEGKPRKRRRRRVGAGAPAANALTRAQRRARHEALRAQRRAHGVTAVVASGNPAILITKLSAGGVATLSRPLPYELAAGAHRGVTLLYAPFSAPTLADGASNPTFQATLHGWLESWPPPRGSLAKCSATAATTSRCGTS